MPLSFLIFGRVVQNLAGQTANYYTTVSSNVQYLAIIAACTAIFTFLASFMSELSAKRQATRIRKLYFAASLRQDEAWFQTARVGSLISKITDNVDRIESGIGEKLTSFITQLSTFLCGIIVSFTLGWELALIGFTGVPLMAGAFASVGILTAKFSAKEQVSYSEAASVSGEVLQNIKTVKAFGGEQDSCNRYSAHLKKAERIFILKETILGITYGIISFTLYTCIALIFWVGVGFIIQGTKLPPGRTTVYTAAQVSSIILIVLVGAINLGFALPSMRSFFEAKASAFEVFKTIDRIPPIDKNAAGKIVENFRGKIQFRNVTFHYPTRPEYNVFENFSLTIDPGETVAFVGPSGSGKSTAIQLILRFYDPQQGDILIDDVNIKELDLMWLRNKMGLVNQEPTLLSGSIADNIRLGRSDATDEEISKVSRMANIHNYIVQLPDRYHTVIGEGGGNLSGGQKQRVAIARALIRDPKILLLDEATSALDTQSEKIVQSAINRAIEGRTVLMIAHRLTTVRDANRIVVMNAGQLVEHGNHDQLFQAHGFYWSMLNKGVSFQFL
ncbi:hypothetical protein Ciccas_013563 [Cichlidogyrus casuarinus]|uniref:Uncharacterized protein n=1 Tax=Cichlidogyrus casuarinus TaxID=1844966 RepID=A0ABD2PM23_9PLAT